jgi:3-mercaptopyruvate sulfurtransferase SseA
MRWACVLAVLLTLVVLFGCAPEAPVHPSDNDTTASSAIPPSERVPRITIDELLQKINNHEEILIVDSRVDVQEQFASGHITGAIPVPLSTIIEGKWLPPQDKEIIFYCT